jgi:hypothetical protein
VSTEQQPWGSEPPTTPAPPGTPEQPRPRWSGRKTAAAVGIAVVIAAGGGAAIWAATANDTGSTPAGPGGGAGGPGAGRFQGAGALDTALHGEFIIADGTTELLQTGKVTQISAASIDVTSTDGYAKSYTIDSATVKNASVKAGTEVTVVAKKSDNVALSVVDRSALPQGGAGRRGQVPPPATP